MAADVDSGKEPDSIVACPPPGWCTYVSVCGGGGHGRGRGRGRGSSPRGMLTLRYLPPRLVYVSVRGVAGGGAGGGAALHGAC